MATTADYYEEEEEDEIESSDGSDDDDDEDEKIVQSGPRPNAVYNSAALREKLEELEWPGGLDWMQTLCVDYHVEAAEIDVEDDLTREMAFYTQALEGTREAFTKLLNTGTPFLRPPDYYAEMVKSDAHMLKVKDMLLSQQKQIEEAEERRKARESKRFAKEVQAQKLKQRAQEKKQNTESVKKWRKMRQDQGFVDDGGEGGFPVDFDDGNDGAGARSSKKGSRELSKSFKRRGGHGDREEFSVDFNGDHGGSKKRKRQDGQTGGTFKKFKGLQSKAISDDHSSGKLRRGGKRRGQPFGSSEKEESRLAFRSAGKNDRSPGPRGGSRGPHRPPNGAPWDRSGGKGKSSSKAGNKKSFQKRQSRNAKYGHGGRKSFKKANTAESSAGFSGLKQRHAKF